MKCYILYRGLTEEVADRLEIRLIAKYKPQLVNIARGGKVNRGYKQSDEAKHNMSLARLGTEPWNKGMLMSEHVIKAQHENNHTNLNVPHSDNHRDKLKESHKGQVPWNKGMKSKSNYNGEFRHKVRSVDIETGDEVVYESVSEASRQLGCARSSIRSALSGKCKTCRKCKWFYI